MKEAVVLSTKRFIVKLYLKLNISFIIEIIIHPSIMMY